MNTETIADSFNLADRIYKRAMGLNADQFADELIIQSKAQEADKHLSEMLLIAAAMILQLSVARAHARQHR